MITVKDDKDDTNDNKHRKDDMSNVAMHLMAEDLHLVAFVVAVEPDALAGRGVAVAAGVDQPNVRDWLDSNPR